MLQTDFPSVKAFACGILTAAVCDICAIVDGMAKENMLRDIDGEATNWRCKGPEAAYSAEHPCPCRSPIRFLHSMKEIFWSPNPLLVR